MLGTSRTYQRPWQKVMVLVGDAVRVTALLSCVAGLVWWGLPGLLRFVGVLAVLLLPRWARVPPLVDAAFGLTVLVSAWSGLLGLYDSIAWWDWVVHLMTNGAIGATAYFLLSAAGIIPGFHDVHVPRPKTRLVVLTLVFGASSAAWWELAEWFGHTYLSEEIFVAYADTVGDLAAGTAGSLLAGCLLAALSPKRAMPSGSCESPRAEG